MQRLAQRGPLPFRGLSLSIAGLPASVETGIRLGTADAAARRAGLQHHGVDVGELLRWEGVPPMFAFRDPDGNGLEVTQQSQADPARV